MPDGSVIRVDAAELRKAYAEFVAEAEAGGFGPPPAGAWGAEQIVAHVARNDEELIGVTAALLGGQQPRFHNHGATDDAEIAGYVESVGDLGALVDVVRGTGERLCALVERADDLSVPVPTSIRDGGRQVIDEPVPWGRLITIQARQHLPGHTEQLRALRR